MPSGELRGSILRGSIYWVLLVWGCFSVSKTIIPDAQEHFLTHSTRRDTHLFGGFGLNCQFNANMSYTVPSGLFRLMSGSSYR
jgi:hypothetical protein